jgi:hypothetical protein
MVMASIARIVRWAPITVNLAFNLTFFLRLRFLDTKAIIGGVSGWECPLLRRRLSREGTKIS